MKKFLVSLILLSSSVTPVKAIDFGEISPVNPLDYNKGTYQFETVLPSYTLKRATLSKNDVKNQYTIAMSKFVKSNVRTSYIDFRNIIDSIAPNDFAFMNLTKEMASIGFFNLSELAMSKIQDDEIASLFLEDVKNFYFPSSKLSQKDQLYLAEMYSNMMYNDQSREATAELVKQTTLLMESDYANYLAAFGNMKNSNIEQAKIFINKAIDKNPKNINYKRLKAEILAQSDNPKDALGYLNELSTDNVQTVIFDNELHSAQEYVLYKSAKNEYQKKYHLAYYYYDKGELNKALGVLQTSISGKKNINKDVYSLTAQVYYDLKEFEKAQDYAQKSLDIDKNNTMALIISGNLASRNKEYLNAQSYYKRACSHDSTHNAEILLAGTYLETGEELKAKNIYAKVLKTSSKIYEAYYRMALLEKDRESAYLKKSVALNPNFTDGWLDMARLAISKEDYDRASSFLGISKYIDDNNYRYYYYMGLVLKNRGLIAESRQNFEKSLNLNPDYAPAKEELSI